MSHPFAVVDLKTTGFSANDRIVEIGVVLLEADGSRSGTWETLVKPNRKIPNPDVHGITGSMVLTAPRFAEIAEELGELLQDRIVATHDARLKIRMLRREFARLGVEVDIAPVCTMHMAQSALETNKKSLNDCLTAIGVQPLEEHYALADALATAKLLQHLLGSHPLPKDCALTYLPPLPTPAPKPPLPRAHADIAEGVFDDDGVEPPTEVFGQPASKSDRGGKRTSHSAASDEDASLVSVALDAPTEIFQKLSPLPEQTPELSRTQKNRSQQRKNSKKSKPEQLPVEDAKEFSVVPEAVASLPTEVFAAPNADMFSLPQEIKDSVASPLPDNAVSTLAAEAKAKVEEIFEGLASGQQCETVEDPDDPLAMWLAEVADRLPKTGDRDADYYLCFLRAVLIDGRINASAVEALVACAEALGINREEVQDLHGRFVRQIVIEALIEDKFGPGEREYLQDAAEQLGVDTYIIEDMLAEPEEEVSDVTPGALFAPGDRVTFTGNLAVPRDAWAYRARRIGLDVGEVTPESAVVVAADLHSTSERVRRARDLDIPIINEVTFARQLSTFKHQFNGEPEEVQTSLDLVLFPWAIGFSPPPASVGEIAALWVTHHPEEPLCRMSAALSPGMVPDGLDRNSRTVAGWFADYPNPLNATVRALSELHG
ncbi:MAG: exonuclease domain-containing protein, partial [Corynebacterium sp.]|nr:exonuclease domain-containing protein [Corynebacterium sp.]